LIKEDNFEKKSRAKGACKITVTCYILRDNPDIEALEAITRSRKMMNGYKGVLI